MTEKPILTCDQDEKKVFVSLCRVKKKGYFGSVSRHDVTTAFEDIASRLGYVKK